MKRRRYLATLSAIAPLAGCSAQQDADRRTRGRQWPMFGRTPARVGATSASGPTERPKLAWQKPTRATFYSSPVVGATGTYAGAAKGELWSLEVDSGSVQWDADFDGRISTPPAYGDGRVFVGTTTGTFAAVDTDALRIAGVALDAVDWSIRLGASVLSATALADGSAYTATTEGTVYGVDAATGDVTWQSVVGRKLVSAPAVAEGSVFVNAPGRRAALVSLDAATGEERWRFEHAHDVGVTTASPSVADGVVVVGSQDGHVYGVDAASGDRLWSAETAGTVVGPPAIADGTVYAGDLDGTAYALDLATGTERWRLELGEAVPAPPCVASGTAYLGTENGTLLALDSTEGTVRWHRSLDSAIRAQPVVSGGVLLVQARDGTLSAFVDAE